MRLAILGGSFNPVHIGHLALADAVRCALAYDLVLLVPANLPPHKELASGALANDRLAMLEAAVAGSEHLGVDDCELSRGGISYTVDTIDFLERKYSGRIEGKIGLVIGEDLVAGFDTWKDASLLADRTDIIVARRPAGDISARDGTHASAAFAYRCAFLENSVLPISSSAIRSAVRDGKSWRYLVPEGVYRYIVAHSLYES